MKLCGLLAEAPSNLGESMHNAAFRKLGLDYCYVAFKTTDTAAGLAAMRALGFRGLSLSIPHKEAALKLVDEIDADVRAIGATNTVINEGGRLLAFNTDWQGIVAALEEAGLELAGQKALIFGAGGAARAAVHALKKMGLREILVTNRTPERAETIARDFQIRATVLEDLGQIDVRDFSLFVNTAPVHDLEHAAIVAALPSTAAVFDMVTCETALMRAARARGLKVLPGTRMLLFQALEQFRLFTGRAAPVEIFEAALQAALG